MDFGQNLKKVMRERGMTQEQLAKRINVERSLISKYCTDECTPSLENFKAIVECLNVSSDYLLFGKKKYYFELARILSELTPREFLILKEAITLLKKIFNRF